MVGFLCRNHWSWMLFLHSSHLIWSFWHKFLVQFQGDRCRTFMTVPFMNLLENFHFIDPELSTGETQNNKISFRREFNSIDYFFLEKALQCNLICEIVINNKFIFTSSRCDKSIKRINTKMCSTIKSFLCSKFVNLVQCVPFKSKFRW